MYKQLNSAVGIFGTPQDAEIAVKELQKSGYDMKKLSMIGGMLVSWIISAMAWGEPLESVGVPKASIHQYQNALRANKFLLIVQGNLQEVEKATNILLHNKAEYANYHKLAIQEIVVEKDSEVT